MNIGDLVYAAFVSHDERLIIVRGCIEAIKKDGEGISFNISGWDGDCWFDEKLCALTKDDFKSKVYDWIGKYIDKKVNLINSEKEFF